MTQEWKNSEKYQTSYLYLSSATSMVWAQVVADVDSLKTIKGKYQSTRVNHNLSASLTFPMANNP